MPRNSDDVILQLYARTPAPCRDYCGLTITNTDAILNIWNITFGPHVYPRRHKCTLENFEHDRYLQTEVLRVFGIHVHDYVMGISRNEYNLQNFPTKVFLNILKYLAAKDVLNLSQTSKILFEVIYKRRKIMRRRPDRHDLIIARNCGWKETLRQKLQLQKRKVIKSGSTAAKTSTNKAVIQKRAHFIEKKTGIIQQNVEKEQLSASNVRTKLDSVKSTSALTPLKVTIPNNLTKSHVKSVVNLNQVKTLPKSLSQTKNDLKINSSSKPVKNSNVRIQMPTLLERLSSYNRSAPAYTKPSTGEDVLRKHPLSAKNKSGTTKK